MKKADRRFVIALMVIIPSFVIIGMMILLSLSSNEANQKIQVDLFHALLPLLAAWVGAVVAFYFGTENLQQAQETLEKSLSAKQELTSKTIDDILKDLPDAKQVRKVQMDTDIKKVAKDLQEMSNVLVVDKINKPLGVLYRWDLAKQAKVNIYEDTGDEDTKDKTLEDFIGEIKNEFITKQPWSITEGIANYALLSLSDNLLQAKQKMEEIAKSDQALLSVRGFVIDKNSKIIAVINFANLTKGIV